MRLLALVITMNLAINVAAEILPARLDQPTGPVRFEAEADKRDWEALSAQIPRPTLQRLWESRDLFDDAAVTFSAALSAPLKAKMYYLISTRGVLPLTPDSLAGQIQYQFQGDTTPPKVNNIAYMGEVVANFAPKVPTVGGFVFVSDQPLRFAVSPVDLSNISTARDSLTYSGRSAHVDGGPHLQEIIFASRLTVEPSHEDYLFVQWKPDDSNCEFFFSLLKITGQTLEEVKWSAYNCDV
jgi:hypothetical protein